MLRIFLLGGTIMLSAAVARADSEIVIAIRYLQAKGTSHSHLYLYREDGKLLRQLTNDNSGQDSDPIFSPNGETIVFTRATQNDKREFWSSDPIGKRVKRLDAAPDWYSPAKTSPELAPTSSPEQSASPAATAEGIQQDQHQNTTALNAVADASDRPPQIIKAPDGSGEIFWRNGEQGEAPEDELNWVMWFRDSKSGQETEIGRLPAFPSFEPLQIRKGNESQFLFEGPLRLTFFSTHLDSQSGSTVLAFDFNKHRLIRLSPNWADPVPLPGEAAFLTLTENRYVQIPGSTMTANCSYIERWGGNITEDCSEKRWAAAIGAEFFEDESWHDLDLKPPICAGVPEVRYARKNSAAICYGASMYRPGKNPAVITIPNAAD